MEKEVGDDLHREEEEADEEAERQKKAKDSSAQCRYVILLGSTWTDGIPWELQDDDSGFRIQSSTVVP